MVIKNLKSFVFLSFLLTMKVNGAATLKSSPRVPLELVPYEGMSSFDISSLASGSYTLHIQTARGNTLRRIVKK